MESSTATSHNSSNNNSTTAKVLPSQSLGLIPPVFQSMPLEQAPGASLTTFSSLPVTSSPFLNSTSTGNGISNTGSNAPTNKPTNILTSTSTSFSPFSSSQQLLVNPVPTLASTPVSSSTAPPAMAFPKSEPSNGGGSNGVPTPLQLMPNTSNTFVNNPQAFIKQEDLNGYQMSSAILPNTNSSTNPLFQPYPNLFKPVTTLPPPTSFISTSSAPMIAPPVLASPSVQEQKKIVNTNSPSINVGNNSGTKIRSKSCQRWTDEQDNKLREAVHKYGARNWKRISDEIGGNFTPDQCNQHWHRVLNPRIIKGDWMPAEDQLLLERVTLFGESSWVKIAEGIAGRTDIQCRHRYFQKKKENETGGSSSSASSSSIIAANSTAPSIATPSTSNIAATVPSITTQSSSNPSTTQPVVPQTSTALKVEKQTPQVRKKKKDKSTGSSLFHLPEDDQTFEFTSNESGFVYLESDVLEDSKKVLNEEDLLAEEEDLSSLVEQKQDTQVATRISPEVPTSEMKQPVKPKSKLASNVKQYIPFSEREDELLGLEVQKESKPNFTQILYTNSIHFHPSRRADQLQTRWEQIQAGKDDESEVGEDESVEDKPKKKRAYTKKNINPKPPISSRHAAALQQLDTTEEPLEVKSKKRTRQNRKGKEEDQIQPSLATKDNPLFAALDFMNKIEEDEKSTAENLINLFKQDKKRSRTTSESEEELEEEDEDDAEIIDDDEMQILDEEDEKPTEQEAAELAKRIASKSSKRFKTYSKEDHTITPAYTLQNTEQETVQSSSNTTPLNVTVVVQRDKEETVLPELDPQDSLFLIHDNQTVESLLQAIAQRLHWQPSSSNITLELYFDNKLLQPSLLISSISQAYRIQDNQLVFTYKQSK